MKEKIDHYLLTQTALKESTKRNYRYKLLNFAKFLDYKNDFDINDVLLFLNSKSFKEVKVSTQNFYKNILRKFLEYLGMDTSTIKNVRDDYEFVRKEDLLTKKEFERYLNNINRVDYRCMVMIFYEGGPRINEIRNVKLKDIVDKKTHYVIHISVSKSKKRPIYLIESAPFLINWLNQHPDKDNPEQFLFCHYRHGNLVRYSLEGIQCYLRRNNPLSKRVYPHLLRHSAVTNNYGILNEKQLMLKFGWKTRSMIDKYAHLSYSEDLESKILELHGILPKNKSEKTLKTIDNKKCPRCAFMNPYTNRFCSRCGSALDILVTFESLQDAENLENFNLESYIKEIIKKEIDKKKID